MKKAMLLGLAMIALVPSQAYAGGSFWAWLEELSGPGPFTGYTPVAASVGCLRKDTKTWTWSCFSPRKQDIRFRLMVDFSRLQTGDRPRFKDRGNNPDNFGPVYAVPVNAMLMFPTHRAVNVGFGAGFIHFSGHEAPATPAFGFTRVVLIPIRAAVTPVALVNRLKNNRWAYVVRAEIETSYVPTGFQGSDFKNFLTTFSTGPEFLTRAAIVVDLGALFGG